MAEKGGCTDTFRTVAQVRTKAVYKGRSVGATIGEGRGGGRAEREGGRKGKGRAGDREGCERTI